MNLFKKTEKDIKFEELINDLKPITRNSQEYNVITGPTATGRQRHIIEFTYKGHQVKVEIF